MSLLFFPSLSDLQWEFILSTMAAQYPEIRKLEINTVTGSALILYNTQAVRANSRFAKVEQYIKMHAERRG